MTEPFWGKITKDLSVSFNLIKSVVASIDQEICIPNIALLPV